MDQLRKMVYGDQGLIMKCIKYNETKIVKLIKERSLRLLGQLCRMQNQDTCRKLTFY
jgi:hypothetical protein